MSINAPQGYSSRNTDVIGFWDSAVGPLHCIPRFVKIFDGNIDKGKPSILIICELVDPIKLRSPEKADDDDEELPLLQGKPGDTIGVWYKPGMKGIANACDLKTYIVLAGEKDVGKGNPMKLFDISSENASTRRIPVIEDTRNRSINVPTVFDAPRRKPDGKPVADDGDVPF